MSKQTPKNSAKPISEPRTSLGTQEPPGQKPDHKQMESENNQTPERIETFPKPNTFPKKWDLSDFFKE